MKVIVGGMHRSGSTWLFNVVRCVLETGGARVARAAYLWHTNRGDDHGSAYDHIILKTHPCRHTVATQGEHIFITHRDLMDVCASAVRTGLTKNTLEGCKYYAKLARGEYDSWLVYKDLTDRIMEIGYGRIKNDKLQLVTDVIDKLGVDCNPDEILETVEALKVPEGKQFISSVYNQETFYHHNHVTDGGIGTYENTIESKVAAELLSFVRRLDANRQLEHQRVVTVI